VLRVEFGDCRLVASWWMTILTLIGVLLFAQLGRWQWHRAAEKRAMAAAFVAGAADFSSDLGTRSTAQLPRYTQVRVHGRYETAHQFLLDNMSHAGQAGYQVLTPFRVDDGRLLLVNRGWVPLPGGRRDVLPDIAMSVLGEVNIGGRVDELPVAGLAFGRAPPGADASWPKRTSFPTMTQLSAALAQTVEPRQLLLAAGEPQGYLRDWQDASAGFPPERHVSYAVQWWGLGALSLFLYLFMNLECRR
jgi:surfeit locus 1 family protein